MAHNGVSSSRRHRTSLPRTRSGNVAIYLDTNAWSDLTEGTTSDAQNALSLARAARSRAIAIFPLGFATITELLKREINADSIVQAELMDILSAGVAFRGTPRIADEGVRSACALDRKSV